MYCFYDLETFVCGGDNQLEVMSLMFWGQISLQGWNLRFCHSAPYSAKLRFMWLCYPPFHPTLRLTSCPRKSLSSTPTWMGFSSRVTLDCSLPT